MRMRSESEAVMRALVNYQPVTESGCWLWMGRTSGGYGVAPLGARGAKKYAHRLFYEAHVGPIGDGAVICHRCDTPSCVNPDHLFLGTVQDNNHDRMKKGRYLGEWNGRARLTAEQAREITSLQGLVTHKEIAAKYGVARSTISMLITGRTWKCLEESRP